MNLFGTKNPNRFPRSIHQYCEFIKMKEASSTQRFGLTLKKNAVHTLSYTHLSGISNDV